MASKQEILNSINQTFRSAINITAAAVKAFMTNFANSVFFKDGDTTTNIIEGNTNWFLKLDRLENTAGAQGITFALNQAGTKITATLAQAPAAPGNQGMATTAEEIDDRVAQLVDEGIGIYVVYDDANDQLTLNAAGTRGAWNAATAYSNNDVVLYSDALYRLSAATGAQLYTSAILPNADNNWQKLGDLFLPSRAHSSFAAGAGITFSAAVDGVVTISGDGSGSGTNNGAIAVLQQKVATLFPLSTLVGTIRAFFAVVMPSVAVQRVDVVDGFSKVFDSWENDESYSQSDVDYIRSQGYTIGGSNLGDNKSRLLRVRSALAPAVGLYNGEARVTNGNSQFSLVRRTRTSWQINARESAHQANTSREILKSSQLAHTSTPANAGTILAPGRHASQVNWTIDNSAQEAGRTLTARRVVINYEFLYATNQFINRDVTFNIAVPAATTQWAEATIFFDPNTNLAYTLQYRIFLNGANIELQTRWHPEGNVPANGAYPWLSPQHIHQYDTVTVVQTVAARDVWTDIRDANNNIVNPGLTVSYLFLQLEPLRDGHDRVVPVVVTNAGGNNEQILQCQDIALLNFDDLPSSLSVIEKRVTQAGSMRLGHAVNPGHELTHAELAHLAAVDLRDEKWLSRIANLHEVGTAIEFDKDIKLATGKTIRGSDDSDLLAGGAVTQLHLGTANLEGATTGLVANTHNWATTVGDQALRFDEDLAGAIIPAGASYDETKGEITLSAGAWLVCAAAKIRNNTLVGLNYQNTRAWIKLDLKYGNTNIRHSNEAYSRWSWHARNNAPNHTPSGGSGQNAFFYEPSVSVTGVVVADGNTPITIRARWEAQNSGGIAIRAAHVHAIKQVG